MGFFKKRRFVRVGSSVAVKCKLENSFELGVTKNISEMGVCLNINRDIKVGECVILSFYLGKTIEVTGRAVWSKKTHDRFNDVYEIGVEFVEPLEKLQEAISKYIRECFEVYGAVKNK